MVKVYKKLIVESRKLLFVEGLKVHEEPISHIEELTQENKSIQKNEADHSKSPPDPNIHVVHQALVNRYESEILE